MKNMKKVYLKFLTVLALLGGSLAYAEQALIEVSLESLSLSPDGPLLVVEGSEPITLKNLHFDKGRFYTRCEVPLTCARCAEAFKETPQVCHRCGGNDFVTLRQPIDILKCHRRLEEALMTGPAVTALQPTGGGEIYADNQGAAVSVGGGVKSKNGQVEAKVVVGGSVGAGGEKDGSVAVSIKVKG